MQFNQQPRPLVQQHAQTVLCVNDVGTGTRSARGAPGFGASLRHAASSLLVSSPTTTVDTWRRRQAPLVRDPYVPGTPCTTTRVLRGRLRVSPPDVRCDLAVATRTHATNPGLEVVVVIVGGVSSHAAGNFARRSRAACRLCLVASLMARSISPACSGPLAGTSAQFRRRFRVRQPVWARAVA